MSEEPPSWTTLEDSPEPARDAPDEGAAAPDVPPGMSFEQALADLERIVQELERGQLDLEAAIQAYERGTALKAHCQQKLQAAQLRVERITLGPDGRVRTEPLDPA